MRVFIQEKICIFQELQRALEEKTRLFFAAAHLEREVRGDAYRDI